MIRSAKARAIQAVANKILASDRAKAIQDKAILVRKVPAKDAPGKSVLTRSAVAEKRTNATASLGASASAGAF
jgi:hypothetical protein